MWYLYKAHVKSCHSDDGDNEDDNEYSDDDTDKVEDDVVHNCTIFLCSLDVRNI